MLYVIDIFSSACLLLSCFGMLMFVELFYDVYVHMHWV